MCMRVFRSGGIILLQLQVGYVYLLSNIPSQRGTRRGRDRMVVGFATTYAYSIHNYFIKFVSDIRQVGGFLRVFRFPPPIKLTATI